jgi:outer membrane protein assembly factor BamD (BamD/ComL family)
MRIVMVLLLSTACLWGCAGVTAVHDAEFEHADRLVTEKKYNEALASYEKIARESSWTERGARALFAEASTRAFYDNPHKDLARALQEFDEFIRRYPANEQVQDAQNLRYLIKTILDLKKENERLNQNIEELKRVDIRHEERRRK